MCLSFNKNKKKLNKVSSLGPLGARSQSVIEPIAFDQGLKFLCHFCGGKSCKHEDYKKNPGSPIEGLNCNWINPSILATQRPSSRIIKQYDIIKQFKENHLYSIVCLQEPGEHPHCGDGIHEASGLSYHPEEFYDQGIYFYNFGWRDHQSTQVNVLLRILKTLDFAMLDGKKIAVHCHAGRGRTAVVICGWLIYHEQMTAAQAVALFKQKRKGSLKGNGQIKTLQVLERYMNIQRQIFFLKPQISLNELIRRQHQIYPYSEKYEKVPIFMNQIMERLELLIATRQTTQEKILLSFYDLNNQTFDEPWNALSETNLQKMKERYNMNTFNISMIKDPRYLAQLMLDTLESFSVPALSNQTQVFLSKISGDSIKKTKENLKLFTDEQKDKKVNKTELGLLIRVKKFLSNFMTVKNKEIINQSVGRIIMALMNIKIDFQNCFLQRSLIDDSYQTLPKVKDLMRILAIWVSLGKEDFLTDQIDSVLSPLHRYSQKKVDNKKSVFQTQNKQSFGEMHDSILSSQQSDKMIKTQKKKLPPLPSKIQVFNYDNDSPPSQGMLSDRSKKAQTVQTQKFDDNLNNGSFYKSPQFGGNNNEGFFNNSHSKQSSINKLHNPQSSGANLMPSGISLVPVVDNSASNRKRSNRLKSQRFATMILDKFQSKESLNKKLDPLQSDRVKGAFYDKFKSYGKELQINIIDVLQVLQNDMNVTNMIVDTEENHQGLVHDHEGSILSRSDHNGLGLELTPDQTPNKTPIVTPFIQSPKN